MITTILGPTPEQFARLFPFHFAFDQSLALCQIGSVLQHTLPNLKIGASVLDSFVLRKPALEWSIDTLRAHEDAVFLLASTTSPLELKGQMLWLPDAERMLFLGWPWVTDATALGTLDIQLADLAPHALIGDFLLVVQSQKTALNDARKLSTALTRQRSELRASEQKYRQLIENLQAVFFQTDAEQRWSFLNPAWAQLTGWSVEETLGTPLLDAIHPGDREHLRERIDTMLANPDQPVQQELRLRSQSGGECWVDLLVYPADESNGAALAGTITDITLRHQEKAAHTRLQEELIQMQASLLEQLSSPLIQLQRGMLVLPLIGSIDQRRAEQITAALLVGVSEHRAHTVIVDITGVPVVDTLVANTLIQATQAVKLLGAQIILTGVRPEVAQTLVGLGVSLDTLLTSPSLEKGMELARQHAPRR